MGVDAVLFSKVRDTPSDDDWDLLGELCGGDVHSEFHLAADHWAAPSRPTVQWDGGRFFPGNGHWPMIAEAAAALQRTFGNVYYGSDHQDVIYRLSYERFCELWAEWVADEWN